ncbi:MAG TPA: hydroxymethylglutaryl-CoA lyase, partial [Burkholderiaceae bacterium]
FASLAEVVALAQREGVPVNVSLSCTFGCPMEGEVAASNVLGWVDRFAALKVQGITLCDTTGMAYPRQVRALCMAALAAHPGIAFTAHFHDTRAMGLPNTLAAIDAGIRSLDMSLGGIGGCPYAPGASGNVATEDVVHLLACEGFATGVDLDGLLAAAAELRRLVQHELASQLWRAGPRLTRHEPPLDFPEIKARALARDLSDPLR